MIIPNFVLVSAGLVVTAIKAFYGINVSINIFLAMILMGIFCLIRLAGFEMGAGDIKMTGLTCICTSFFFTVRSCLIGSAAGLCYGFYLLIIKKNEYEIENLKIKFGPFLAFGVIFSFLMETIE